MTNEQKMFILEHHGKLTSKEICEKLNIKPYQLNYFLRQNHLSHHTKRDYSTWATFSQNDIQYIKEHYLYMTYAEIGKVLGFSERQIRGKINNMHLPKNRQINEHYFDTIDTPLKAYFLGFIFADGWICYNEKNMNYEFGMELQSGDRYVLDELNKALGDQNIICHSGPAEVMINNHIAHKNDSDILRVYSKALVLGLMKNGIETNKSQKDAYPTVSRNLFFDFLRGYIDGDGCFYTKGNSTTMHITCSSNAPLLYIRDTLFEYGIKTVVRKETERKYRLLCSSRKDMNELVNRLYYEDGLFCLTRKYEKIKHFLGFAA